MNCFRVRERSVLSTGVPTIPGIVLFLFLWASVAKADGLSVRNVSQAPRDAKTATVSFDVAWEHSWRRGSFHDAAWVFFKIRADSKSPWQTARLAADKVVNPTGYGQASGGSRLEFIVPDGDDGFLGVFLRRAEEGSGPVAAQRVTVVLDITAITEIAKAQIQPFGLEMVYVPEGPFQLGVAAGKELNRFYTYGDGGPATPPYTVSGPGPIATGRQPGRLWATGIVPEDGGEIPAAFPNGYRAFYALRFAITQGQYADFLNALPEAETARRYFPEGHGKWIGRSGEPPNRVYEPLGKFPNMWFRPAAPDRDHRCPWLSSADSAGFAAWAGLRPMTELEYEKMCRGPALPVLSDQSGSFWGVDDLNTGQMYERPISVGSAAGRSFQGSHGRGTTELPADWPKDSSASILRGDVLHTREYTSGAHQRISGRLNAVDSHADRKPHPFAAWRGVRTAPAGDAAMRPVIGRFDPHQPWKLPRRATPVVVDGKLDEWTEPTFVLNETRDVFPMTHSPVSRRFPTPRLPNCWGGPADLGARIFIAKDGNDLCFAVEVTDDRHFNNRTGTDIAEGDSLQIGISTQDGHRSFGLAKTADGVVFHQWQAAEESLLKLVDCAVTRDDAKAVTRYELRLPAAALRLEPNAEFGFNVVVYDDDDPDDGKAAPEWIQMAPGTARGPAGGNGAKYLKFVSKE